MATIKSLTRNILNSHIIKIITIIKVQLITAHKVREIVELAHVQCVVKRNGAEHVDLATVSVLSAALTSEEVVTVLTFTFLRGLYVVGGGVHLVSSNCEVAVN